MDVDLKAKEKQCEMCSPQPFLNEVKETLHDLGIIMVSILP